MSLRIKELLDRDSPLDSLTVQGWVRTRRDAKTFSFLELNDGSCLRNLQVVIDAGVPGYDRIAEFTTGASMQLEGRLVVSKGSGQKWEVHATSLRVLGGSDETFPLQKKGHSPEFLRTIAHLRPRTNLFGSIFRVRSRLAMAVHRFFQQQGFFYVQTPIITGSDCEGAGEMFRVTTLRGSSDTPRSSDTPVAGADEPSRSSDTPVAEVNEPSRSSDTLVAGMNPASRSSDTPVAGMNEPSRSSDTLVAEVNPASRSSDTPVAGM
ncbi:MAG: OB-fold nucleic acid binding domain-containing protein, partial [Verrucomicrobiales bacterium]